jgi:DNA-binding MarR family transcriptional regulator
MGVYAHKLGGHPLKSRNRRRAVSAAAHPIEACTCLALRQAARHVTQLYDRCLAPCGLRSTQFSILAMLKRSGAMTINALADKMVMDRTTLGRNILPLQRMRLIAVRRGREDRRSKKLELTPAGAARLSAAAKRWAQAQSRFEAAFAGGRTADLRALLQAVVASDLATATGADHGRRSSRR